jgi:hypothetical protein
VLLQVKNKKDLTEEDVKASYGLQMRQKASKVSRWCGPPPCDITTSGACFPRSAMQVINTLKTQWTDESSSDQVSRRTIYVIALP